MRRGSTAMSDLRACGGDGDDPPPKDGARVPDLRNICAAFIDELTEVNRKSPLAVVATEDSASRSVPDLN